MKKKNYNLNISLIRFILCISVLFYHLGILKGGYLAVCSFFVISGYFSTKSLDTNALISHYKKRLKKIYLPLIIVLFSSVGIISLLKMNIFNIKSEVTSILLGYNNYWQLSANSDYFAKHLNSPFMHFWYISILLQIELLFPIIFISIKKIGEKVSKFLSFELVFALAVITTIYFYKNSLNNNLMTTYYDTFSRLFSFLYGVLVYFIHKYTKKITVLIKNISFSVIIFILYLLLLCSLFIFIEPQNKYFAISMVITSLITMRLIEYAIFLYKYDKVVKDKFINFISNISYEIYLVQYPVIYLFNNLKINYIVKDILIIIITIFISWIIYFALQILNKAKYKLFRIIISLPILCITVFGIYHYVIMKDDSKEIKDLKEKLSNNEMLMKQKQEEYLKRELEEEKKMDDYIKSLEVNEDELRNYVNNLRIVGVGDSVLLDAIDTLYKEFPNGYFDGKVSRSTCASVSVLSEIKSRGITWDVLVFNLGTNDYPTDKCKNELMAVAGDSLVFWLNTTHPDYDNCNEELEKYASKHENIHILDWESVVKNHPEYLYSDYTHLKPNGFKPYVDFIKESIYNYYLNQKNQEKEKLINEYSSNKKEKYSFYGNELLINIFELLQEDFKESNFIALEDMDYNKLLEKIDNDKKLNNKIILVFDDKSKISEINYNELIEKYQDKTFYIISLKHLNLNYDNANVLELILNEDDYLSDKIHLNEEGNKKLVAKIKEILKN